MFPFWCAEYNPSRHLRPDDRLRNDPMARERLTPGLRLRKLLHQNKYLMSHKMEMCDRERKMKKTDITLF